jgi:hypothetical protein
VIAAYILIQGRSRQGGHRGRGARDVQGVWETASLAGPCDVIARTGARDIDEMARLVTSRVHALDGVTRTMSCLVVHL